MLQEIAMAEHVSEGKVVAHVLTRADRQQYSTRTGATSSQSGGRPSSTRVSPFNDGRTAEEISRDANKLIQEALQLASETPPQASLPSCRLFLTINGRSGSGGRSKQRALGRAPTTEDVINQAPATIRRLFELLGATYVKLGQFIASSPTLFPAEYVKEFQKCLDSTESVPFSRIKVRKARFSFSFSFSPSFSSCDNLYHHFGDDDDHCSELSTVFAFVEEKPLASASIAQVEGEKERGSGGRGCRMCKSPRLWEVGSFKEGYDNVSRFMLPS
eukprot:751854-Hanusia_phi.AAC.1